MKRIIILSAASLFIMFATLTNTAFSQDDNMPQNKSYVKIKTMKIVNGDTIVTEKDYTGNGNMHIEDSLNGEGFGNFQFNTFNNFNDSSFNNVFPDMQNMFRGFDLNSNKMFFNDFKFPNFQMNFDIDSIFKEYNFRYNDSLFQSLQNNKPIME